MGSSLDYYYDKMEEENWERQCNEAKEKGVPVDLALKLNAFIVYFNKNKNGFSYGVGRDMEQFIEDFEKYSVRP